MKLFIPFLVLLVLIVVNIAFGAISVDWQEVFWGTTSTDNWMRWLVFEERVPRTFLALLCGSNLALAGAMLQTLFKNPLAGPGTLGINAGAALGVALLILLSNAIGFEPSNFWMMLFAFIGALLFLFLLLVFYQIFKSLATLLIIGLLLGYLSFAIIEVLLKFSHAESIKNYLFWGMGNFDRSSWQYVGLLFGITAPLWVYIFKLAPYFNVFLLGESELKLLGYNTKYQQIILFSIIGVLVATVTAFVGPLAFVGVAVPNIIKLLYKKSNHRFIFTHTIIWGGIFTLLADFLSRAVLWEITLPLNALLSILALPIILIFLLKNKLYGKV